MFENTVYQMKMKHLNSFIENWFKCSIIIFFFFFSFLQEGKHKCIYSVETTSVCQSLCHTYKITEMFPYLSLTWSWYFSIMKE